MFCTEDEFVLFVYSWTYNEMQIPARRDRQRHRRLFDRLPADVTQRYCVAPFLRRAISIPLGN